MADLTKLALKQIRTGISELWGFTSGVAVDANTQRLISASGILTGTIDSLSGYVNTGFSRVGHSHLVVTGLTTSGSSPSLTGLVTLTGVDSNRIIFSGNTILFSGVNTGNFVTTSMTGTLVPTGLTGNFITTDQTGRFVATGNMLILKVTGSSNISGVTTVAGISGIKPILTAPNTITISTDNIATGFNTSGSANLYGAITITGVGGLQIQFSGASPIPTILVSGRLVLLRVK